MFAQCDALPLVVVFCITGSSDPERQVVQEKLIQCRGITGDSPRDSGCYESNENLENVIENLENVKEILENGNEISSPP